ncbi:MAG: tetratricopeptide repeat protein [Chthoniobacterales bacterium]
MQNPHEKVERSLLKIIGWSIAVIVLISVASVFGYRTFRAWQERKLIAQGNAFANQGDFKHASLNARRIIQLDPENPEGFRLLARVAEKTASAAAIDARRRVVDLGHPTAEDLILLARDAVRFDDKPTADLAMSKLPAEAKNRADYHALLADIAYAQRHGVEMERELSEALRLDPTNKDYAMRLAALRLNANDRAMSERGRETLLELRKDPAFRLEVTRHLAENAIRRNDFDEALKLARELDAMPDRQFTDRLVLLSALKASADPTFPQFLSELQNSVGDNREAIAALISWLNANRMAQDAIAWAAKLPSELVSGHAVPIALADSYVAANDWAGLLRLTKAGNWGTLDFLRTALAARAYRELGQDSDAKAPWADAVRKVTGNTRTALLLAETVAKWNWQSESIDLLWAATKDEVKGDEALRTLYQHFASTDDTANLYRVLIRQLERHPEDDNVKNNVAELSLLLKINAARGRDLAREVYQKDPHNPAYVSTYAFSLFDNGDVKKALQTMETLSEDQRRQPQIAAYYGVMLVAAGDKTRAKEFLDLGERTKLLPEEKALVDRARRSVAEQ